MIFIKMNSIVAYCGLICDTCPIHLATIETNIDNQARMRVQIADQLSKIYGTSPKQDIITDCDGCKADNGRLFTGCVDSEIRKCATMKEMINCAYCSDFTCEKLRKHYKIDPGSRDRLEEIRKRQSAI
jgi:hypothetical protein